MTQTVRYIHVKQYRTTGRGACLYVDATGRCGKSATVTAFRRRMGFDLPVRYCDTHAVELGVTR